MQLKAACGADGGGGGGLCCPLCCQLLSNGCVRQLRACVDVRAVETGGIKLRLAQRSAATQRVNGAGPRAPGRNCVIWGPSRRRFGSTSGSVPLSFLPRLIRGMRIDAGGTARCGKRRDARLRSPQSAWTYHVEGHHVPKPWT